MTTTRNPASTQDRYASLDVLRGFALLGILLMNIQSYAMIEAAYINPMAYGDMTGLHRWVWILSHIIADQKFISIFSILFGASILLFSERLEARGQKPASMHYRRIFWLLIIGLVHAYLLWHGDILVTYALCGSLIFLFRKMKPRTLMILGIITLSVSSVLYILNGLTIPYWPEDSVQATIQAWLPDQDTIAAELTAYRSGFISQMSHRFPASVKFQTFIFLMYTGWRAAGPMLIGMAFYKWGILTAKRSVQFYQRMTLIGLGIGLPLIIYGVIQNFAHNWTFEYSLFLGFQYNYWGSMFLATGYIGLVLWIFLKTKSKFLDALNAVGRMALTNYLMQTVICTLIFYSPGLGRFGQVERLGQLFIVIAIWILQLLLSPVWLKHFRFGPAEWAWRSLTYWKRQPMKKIESS